MNYGELRASLGFQLARASVAAFRTYEACIGQPLKLRRAEYSVLALLRANDRVTAKGLAVSLSISLPNMSVLLDRLVERDLLRRIPDERDRRAQLIELTDAGRRLADMAAGVAATMEQDLLNVLSTSEQNLLLEMLNRVSSRGEHG